MSARLPTAAKALEKEGTEAYYVFAKSICSDFRILTERMVEMVLLGGVVERHSREVKTKNLLHDLTRITHSDCDLIDGLMTKYSKYEHSQSAEAPGEVPPPDELRDDIQILIAWHDDFKSRKQKEPVPGRGVHGDAALGGTRAVSAVK